MRRTGGAHGGGGGGGGSEGEADGAARGAGRRGIAWFTWVWCIGRLYFSDFSIMEYDCGRQ